MLLNTGVLINPKKILRISPGVVFPFSVSEINILKVLK